MTTATTPGVEQPCICPRADHPHGSLGRYKRDGCRCSACRTANRLNKRRVDRGHAYAHWAEVPTAMEPVIGTRRRLHALTAVGWSAHALAERLGVTQGVVAALSTRTKRVHPSTAAAVRRLYDDLWDQTPPAAGSERARRYAAAQGWPPPMAWDDDDLDDPAATPNHELPVTEIDEVLLERALAGERTRVQARERLSVVAALTGQERSAEEIAQILGLCARSVVRDRAQLAS